MRVGEAFEKVSSELGQTVSEELGLDVDEETGSLAMHDMEKLGEPTATLVRLSYDGSAKDFSSSRAKIFRLQVTVLAVSSSWAARLDGVS